MEESEFACHYNPNFKEEYEQELQDAIPKVVDESLHRQIAIQIQRYMEFSYHWERSKNTSACIQARLALITLRRLCTQRRNEMGDERAALPKEVGRYKMNTWERTAPKGSVHNPLTGAHETEEDKKLMARKIRAEIFFARISNPDGYRATGQRRKEDKELPLDQHAKFYKRPPRRRPKDRR